MKIHGELRKQGDSFRRARYMKKIDKTIYGFALTSEDSGKFLFVKRSSWRREYPNFWSLPTITVTEERYREFVKQWHLKKGDFVECVNASYPNARFSASQLLMVAKRVRQEYTLEMALVRLEGVLSFEEDLLSKEKYCDLSWMTTEQAIQLNDNLVGTCFSMHIQNQIEQAKMGQNTYYLEVQPELSRRELLEELSDDELWCRCSGTYASLKAGDSGGDGHVVRALALDPYVHDTLLKISNGRRLLDVGCGQGELVSLLRKSGVEALGLDVSPTGSCNFAHHIFYASSVFDAKEMFAKHSFDLLVLNLVVNWISDINGLAEIIESLGSRNSEIHVTITPPEFSKNGEWELGSRNPQWNIREPFRRQPFLTMINRGVGPVRFFPHTMADLIVAFSRVGYFCKDVRYLFIDTCGNGAALKAAIVQRPYLVRHQFYPAFIYFIFHRGTLCE